MSFSYKNLSLYQGIKLRYNAWEDQQLINTAIQHKKIPQWSIDNKAIFIHIPRTAGSSIVKAGIKEVYGHVSYDWYKNRIPDEYDNYFKFAFVRNPWDRLVSIYFYLNQVQSPLDRLWAEQNIKKYKTFEEFVLCWVNEINIRKYMHFIPQYSYLYNNSLQLEVDFVGRFETLDKDYAIIANKLGIKPVLPKVNSSNKLSYRDYYTPELVTIVSDVYRQDIDLFEYKY